MAERKSSKRSGRQEIPAAAPPAGSDRHKRPKEQFHLDPELQDALIDFCDQHNPRIQKTAAMTAALQLFLYSKGYWPITPNKHVAAVLAKLGLTPERRQLLEQCNAAMGMLDVELRRLREIAKRSPLGHLPDDL